MPTFSLTSLGCAKNLVNSEQMLYLLQEAGFRNVPDPEGADFAVINTCGFIDAAKSEAIDCILEHAALKAEGRLGAIIVTGCLSERYRAVGARGGAVINIGQHMGVVVDNVDTELNRIDFRFEDEFEHMPAKKGFSSSYRSEKPSRGGRKTSDYRPSKGRTGGKPKSFGGRTGRGGKKGRR